MKNKKKDERIAKYREATRKMSTGQFPVEIPREGEDDLSKLGKNLYELGQTLQRKFEKINALSKITEKINAGLLMDEVLDNVYDFFRSLIPYDRIGFALLEKEEAAPCRPA